VALVVKKPVVGELLKSLPIVTTALAVDDENAASCALCERIGMTLEGTLRNERRAPDGLRNTRIYAIVS